MGSNERENEIEVDNNYITKCNLYKDAVIGDSKQNIYGICCDIVLCEYRETTLDIQSNLNFSEYSYKIVDNKGLLHIKVHYDNTFFTLYKHLRDNRGKCRIEYGTKEICDIRSVILELPYSIESNNELHSALSLCRGYRLNYEDTYRVLREAIIIRQMTRSVVKDACRYPNWFIGGSTYAITDTDLWENKWLLEYISKHNNDVQCLNNDAINDMLYRVYRRDETDSDKRAWIGLESMRGNELVVKGHTLIECSVRKDLTISDIDEVIKHIQIVKGHSNVNVRILGDVRFSTDCMLDENIRFEVNNKDTYNRICLNGIIWGGLNPPLYGEKRISDVMHSIIVDWYLWYYEYDNTIQVNTSCKEELNYEETYNAIVECIDTIEYIEVSMHKLDGSDLLSEWYRQNFTQKMTEFMERRRETFKECLIKDAGRKKLSGLNEDAIKDIIENYTVKECC